MFQWLSDRSDVLNLLVNVGMLLVWIVYLQLFLANFREQRRPNILINRGAGTGLSARCLISNMSSEAIYVVSIIASFRGGGRSLSCAVTDLEELEAEQIHDDPKRRTRQGPLASGGYMDIGSFGGLLERVLRSNGEAAGQDPLSQAAGGLFEIQVIASYGSEKLLVGGRRRFDLVEQEGSLILRPRELDTHQITARRHRRKIEKMLKSDL